MISLKSLIYESLVNLKLTFDFTGEICPIGFCPYFPTWTRNL